MYDYKDIRHVHLEISTRCNATCPLCPRNMFGVEIIDDYPIHDMTLSEAQQIFTTDFLKQLTHILINGNLGDFVTARDGLEIVRYFNQVNPKIGIYISTNASARPNIWPELGKLGIVVGFDIDGLRDTHSLYRQYTDWDMIINNAKNFIAAGGRANWRMIKFDHNQHQIEECEQLSKELGFKKFELLDCGRDTGPVFNRQGKLTHFIGDPTKNYTTFNFEDLKTGEFNRRSKFEKTPLTFYRELPTPKEISCQAQKIKSMFITATGLAYPCCDTGFYPGQTFHAGNDQISKLQQDNNILEYGIEHAVAWFNKIEEQWKKPDYESGSLYICNNTCGVK